MAEGSSFVHRPKEPPGPPSPPPLPQDPFKRFLLYGSLADAAALSPALGAALLADGLVEVLLADLTGEASEEEHRIPEPQVSLGSSRWLK